MATCATRAPAALPGGDVPGHVECEGLPKVKFKPLLKAQLDFADPRGVPETLRIGAGTPPDRTLAAPEPRSVFGRALRTPLGVTWYVIGGRFGYAGPSNTLVWK